MDAAVLVTGEDGVCKFKHAVKLFIVLLTPNTHTIVG